MELAFATKALRSLCEDEDAAVEKFGKKVAGELRARIADLRAADSVRDIVAGSPQFFDEDPRMTISVFETLQIVLRPNHVKMPRHAEGGIDWSRIRRLRIDKLNQPAGGG
jgi:toxin HigB-1